MAINENKSLGRRVKSQAGLTLIELSVVVTMIGILSAMVVPFYHRAMEGTRVELAASRLETIWTAQRIYWLTNRVFTSDMTVLTGEGLLGKDIQDASDPACTFCNFTYDITFADADTFTVDAVRSNSNKWSGTVTIDQDGLLTGSITDMVYTIQPTSYR